MIEVGDLVTAYTPEAQKNGTDMTWGIVVERYRILQDYDAIGVPHYEAMADVYWPCHGRVISISTDLLWKSDQVFSETQK